MAAHARLKNEFREDDKYHNLMRWLICFHSKDPLADLQYGNKIAELVLLTEDTINISDAYTDPRFDREVSIYYQYLRCLH